VELHEVLSIDACDGEAFAYARAHNFITVTCNRDDYLALAVKQPHPGLIILIRRLSRHSECAHLLALLKRAGEAGLDGNINFA
jgi:hypothetical protein